MMMGFVNVIVCGVVDFGIEIQDLYVYVVLKISVGVVVIGVVIINLLFGVGVLVVNYVLFEMLLCVFVFDYVIIGLWVYLYIEWVWSDQGKMNYGLVDVVNY